MEPFADVMCELKVRFQCGKCKVLLHEVLGSITGVYSILIDGEGEKVKVEGQVDPNLLIRALARTDIHAKVIRVKLKHPQAGRRGSSYYNNLNYGDYSYGPRNYLFEPTGSNRYGFRGPGPLPGISLYGPSKQYHDYQRRSPYVEYPFSCGRNYNLGPLYGPTW